MGDQGSESATAPLLGHPDEDRLWDSVEQATPVDGITVRQLIHERPEGVLHYLQRSGVKKLGEFCLEDSIVLGKLGDDSIVTMGADQASIDYEAAWRRELGSCKVEKTGWTTTIPVLAYVVAIKGAAKPDKDGLLQPLLRRWQAGGCSFSVFALPAVQAVIDWKWARFCRKLLLWELGAFLIWLSAFSVFTIAFQDEDTTLSLHQLLSTSRGRLTVAMDMLGMLGMAPFLVIEAATVWAYGWGWVQVWNLLDTATYAIQIAVVTMHLGRLNISSGWLSIAAAMQCVLLLFRVQYFSRVFRPTRFAFVDSLKEVLHDVKWYLLFLVIIMWGFATGFHVLFRQDQKEHEEFSTIGKAFITMVTWVAGNADLNPLYKHSHNPVAACTMAVIYVFVLTMVLLNLLVGVMTNTLEKVTENEGLRMLLSKAQVIDELESTIPPWIERMFPQLYPPYLHVLRVDPERLDRVKADNLWAMEGDDEGQQLIQGAEASSRVAPAEGKRAERKGGAGVGAGAGAGEGSREDSAEAKAKAKEETRRAREKDSVLEQKVDAVWKELQELKAYLRAPGGWHVESPRAQLSGSPSRAEP